MGRRLTSLIGKVYKVQVLDANGERVLWEEGPYASIGAAKARATHIKHADLRRSHKGYFTQVLALEGDWYEL